MAKGGFKVIDCDMHIHEPHDLWQRYIDPKFKDRAPVGLNRHFRDIGIQFGGEPVKALADMPFVPGFKALRDAINVKRYSDEMKQGFNSKSQLSAMAVRRSWRVRMRGRNLNCRALTCLARKRRNSYCTVRS